MSYATANHSHPLLSQLNLIFYKQDQVRDLKSQSPSVPQVSLFARHNANPKPWQPYIPAPSCTKEMTPVTLSEGPASTQIAFRGAISVNTEEELRGDEDESGGITRRRRRGVGSLYARKEDGFGPSL